MVLGEVGVEHRRVIRGDLDAVLRTLVVDHLGPLPCKDIVERGTVGDVDLVEAGRGVHVRQPAAAVEPEVIHDGRAMASCNAGVDNMGADKTRAPGHQDAHTQPF